MAENIGNDFLVDEKEEETLDIRDFVFMCLSRWYWFVISLILCVAVAVAYLLRTPESYTREASILVKSEGKGGTVNSDITSQLSNLGMMTFSSSVNDEVINLQSPDLMYSVVKRLSLNMSYMRDGMFHKETLYGNTLPVEVKFKGLKDKDVVTFTMTPDGDDVVVISDLTKVINNEEYEYDGERRVKIGEATKTPSVRYSWRRPNIVSRNLSTILST